jgi:hypothetical protein
LDRAYREFHSKGPVYLFFSVNGRYSPRQLLPLSLSFFLLPCSSSFLPPFTTP